MSYDDYEETDEWKLMVPKFIHVANNHFRYFL